MKRVLVIVTADPRRTDRGIEALRMSAGVVAAGNEVRVALTGESARLLGRECAGLPGGGRAINLIGALRELGATVEAEEDAALLIPDFDVVVRWTDG